MQKLRQNKKTIITVIIAVVIAVLISVSSCYVLAETLINSKDVVYQDNSNLMADNVQEAIDGTCSKIDTRLSDIEDNLYTIKNISGQKNFISSSSFTYTDVSVELPANSYCSITYWLFWGHNYPIGLFVSSSPTIGGSRSLAMAQDAVDYATQRLSVSINEYTGSQPVTRYIWAKYNDSTENTAGYWGFCATKYK